MSAYPATAPSLPAHPVTRRFPLVARPRLRCGPLVERLADITELTFDPALDDVDDSASEEAERLRAVAYNKAALLASDCGHTELARELCWTHHDRYQDRRPWNLHRARLALEPLVNLARLRTRSDEPDQALDVLTALWTAVNDRDAVEIEGRHIVLALNDDQDGHRELRRTVWMTLLRDGVRALCAGGRPDAAARLAREHHGIGDRLLDGRQAAILDLVATGNHARAHAMVEQSRTEQPWERVVAESLHAVADQAGSTLTRARREALVQGYTTLECPPEHAVFLVHLGLAVLDLLGGVDAPDAVPVLHRLIDMATTTTDAGVARALLRDSALPASARRHATALVRAAGFPPHIQADLPERLRRSLGNDRAARTESTGSNVVVPAPAPHDMSTIHPTGTQPATRPQRTRS